MSSSSPLRFGVKSPIKQWMYYDAAEALPEKPLPKEEVQPVGSRYDGSIMVFGKTMQVRPSVCVCVCFGSLGHSPVVLFFVFQ